MSRLEQINQTKSGKPVVSIDSNLLEILRCPLTKQPLSILSQEKLDEINCLIETGQVCHTDGTTVENKIVAALITKNGNWVYRIDAGIPVMLHGQSIPMSDLMDSAAPEAEK